LEIMVVKWLSDKVSKGAVLSLLIMGLE